MRNFGFQGYDNVIYPGTNGKMTEISAAMGLTNFAELDRFVAANRRNYEAYREELGGHSALELLSYDDREKCNYQYIVVTVDEKKAHLSRDDIVKELHNHNIIARRYFYPGCHRFEPYRSEQPSAGLQIGIAEHQEGTERALALQPVEHGRVAAHASSACAWETSLSPRPDRPTRIALSGSCSASFSA